jgi:hypothetical protein
MQEGIRLFCFEVRASRRVRVRGVRRSGKENTPEEGVYFVLCVFVLYFVLYLYFWRQPPVTVAAAASAMAPRVLAVHLALGYAQCLTLSSIM